MYIYFVWKIVVLKMLDSLERIYRSGYLLIVIDIFVYVFIKRSCYIVMGRYCFVFVGFFWFFIGNFFLLFDVFFIMKLIM